MMHIHDLADRAPYSTADRALGYQRPLQLILAEDDPDYARALMRRFAGSQSARYRVTCIPNLDAVFARLEVRRPDAILLDLNLLDSRGVNTLVYACSVAKRIPILVLTADASPALAELARRAGACDYLIKSTHDFASIERGVLTAIARSKRSRDLASFRRGSRASGAFG